MLLHRGLGQFPWPYSMLLSSAGLQLYRMSSAVRTRISAGQLFCLSFSCLSNMLCADLDVGQAPVGNGWQIPRYIPPSRVRES